MHTGISYTYSDMGNTSIHTVIWVIHTVIWVIHTAIWVIRTVIWVIFRTRFCFTWVIVLQERGLNMEYKQFIRTL